MTYLIAKFIVLFAAASFFGFLLGRWLTRRRFVDVTETFEAMSQSDDGKQWEEVLTQFAGFGGTVRRAVQAEISALPQPQIPELDLGAVESRLAQIDQRFASLPTPQATDLAPVSARIGALETLIKNLPRPEPAKPADLTPVTQRFASLEKTIANLPRPAPAVDLGPATERIASIEKTIANLPRPAPAVDLGPATERIASLEKAIVNLPRPVPAPAVNLEPTTERIASLEKTIANLPRPAAPAPTDLSPVTQRISSLEKMLQDLPRPEPTRPVDLAPIGQRLTAVEQGLRGIRIPEATPATNLAPLNDRIGALERAVREIRIPQATSLEPVSERLTRIERQLEGLAKRPVAPAPVAVPTPRPLVRQAAPVAQKTAAPSAGPRLLKSAAHGTKDDLKRIHGVGPKLERMLNDNGVYYFWQVSDWTRRDIEIVDARLEVFRGRIERDDWVSQAKRLMREPGAATRPSN